VSYNPYETQMPPTTAWPPEQPPSQVPGWGPQGMAPMGPPPAPGNKSSPALIIVLVVLAVAAIGAGAFFLTSGDDDDAPTATNSNRTDNPTADDNSPVTTLPGGDDGIDVNVDDTTPGLPGDPGDSGDVPGNGGLDDHEGVTIEETAATAGPPGTPPTGDPALEDLAQQCADGSMTACDDLYLASPVGSDFEAYGDTCGARVPDAHNYYCADLLPDA